MTPAIPRHLVMIGGGFSAVDSLVQFFSSSFSSQGMSFVIALHGMDRLSGVKLPDRLTRATQLPVEVISDGTRIESGRVYVAKCGQRLRLRQGIFYQDEFGNRGWETEHDVDGLFESIAKEWGSRSFAVLLSGQGLDGIRGLQNVREAGGTIMVQSPLSAAESALPAAALERVPADFVLDPKNLMAQCQTLAEGVWPVVSEPNQADLDQADPQTDEQALSHLFDIVNQRTNIDLSGYRHPTILRQIEKRMRLGRLRKLIDYSDRLTLDTPECEALSRECLIGVTSFFRDPDAFEILYRKCIRSLVEQVPTGEAIRIWVPACSSGEEAYSLAILFLEAELSLGRLVEFKIFATDIDAQAVHSAAAGLFSAAQISSLPARFQVKYFAKRNDKFSVVPFLRERIVFAQHDLLRSPPFRNLNLISCRNLLIYLGSDLQRQVAETFQKSLVERGYLFLGLSESFGGPEAGFERVSDSARIYRKADTEAAPNPFSDGRKANAASEHSLKFGFEGVEGRLGHVQFTPAPELQAELRNRIVTGLITIPSVTLAEDGSVLSSHGELGRYFIHSEGFEIHKAHDLLRKPYRRAFHSLWFCLRLLQERRAIFMPSSSSAGDKIVFLEGRRLDTDQNSRKVYQVRFLNECDLPLALGAYPNSESNENRLENTASNERNGDNVRLRALMNALESANFEIQSSNEELLSANEELSSINEEFRASNTELQRLNDNHVAEISELKNTKGELGNLLGAAGVALLGLDSQLCIESFSAGCERYIHVVDNDIGRPLEHLAFRVHCGCQSERLLDVLRDGKMAQWRMPLGREGQVLVRVVPNNMQPGTSISGLKIFFIDLGKVMGTQILRSNNGLSALQLPENAGRPSAESPRLHRTFTTNDGDLVI